MKPKSDRGRGRSTGKAGRSRTDDSQQTADRILEVAVSLWAEKGFEATTMRELAARAGMGIGTLYFHFPSKEELVQYLYDQVNRQAIDKFRATDDATTDLVPAVQRYLKIKLEMLEPHRHALPAVLREAIDPESKLSPFAAASSATLDRNLQLFRELVARSRKVAEADRAAAARLIWMAHMAILLYWLHDRSESKVNTAELIDTLGGWPMAMPLLRRLPGPKRIARLVGALFTGAPSSDAATTEPGADAGVEPVDRTADIVVIGGGPIGCLYASFLKRMRPHTRVLLLERAPEPGHKVGESTLSGFCKALRTVGIRHDAMRRLFYPKNGHGFLHVDESIRELTTAPEYILETFDETFQVERRVLDTLLIGNARRLGVEVLEGAKVALDDSRITGDGCVVRYHIGDRGYRASCRLVVDASGPGRLLGRHRDFGQWTTVGLTFQTSAAWSYWHGIQPLGVRTGWHGQAQFARDEYTQHVCFREGWLWYILLNSWQATPSRNLARMLDRLSVAGRLPDADELEHTFGAPRLPIVSVGLVLRSDRDDGRIAEDARAALDVYRQRYPAIDNLLAGAKMLDDHYGHGAPFQQRLDMRGHARRPAGDGYLLIGDAAFFVDPLISPGLTGGTATAYKAAETTVRLLDGETAGDQALADYTAYVHDLHTALERDNQLVYMSFNHPEALKLVQRLQEVDARRHFLAHERTEYGADDTNVWGILSAPYLEMQQSAWSLLRQAEEDAGRRLSVREQSPRDYQQAIPELENILGDYLRENQSLTPYVKHNPGLVGPDTRR